jgi:hypothetical protein
MWWVTNDVEKRTRWQEMIAWAEANGCPALVEGVRDEHFYQVEEPDDVEVGPLGGPCYLRRNYETKQRPSREGIFRHLDHLRSHWSDIAGPALSAITRPLAFSGKKARRLLVFAESAASPPWGGWTYRSRIEDERRTFTQFRSAVNTVIAPHKVDHIGFLPVVGVRSH